MGRIYDRNLAPLLNAKPLHIVEGRRHYTARRALSLIHLQVSIKEVASGFQIRITTVVSCISIEYIVYQSIHSEIRHQVYCGNARDVVFRRGLYGISNQVLSGFKEG